MSNKNNSSIFQYNNKRTNTSKMISLNNNQENNSNKKTTDELKNIFNSILSESSQTNELIYTTNELLSYYIRRNRNKLNETLIEISKFFYNNKISTELLIQCMEGINNSLMENNQIINFLDKMVPILIKSLYQIKNQNLSTINKLVSFIGKLIKQGGIYIRELIESNIDKLLQQFNSQNENYINEGNTKAISIQLFSQIFKNSSLLAFNKIVGKEGIDKFLKVIYCFNDSKKEIRIMTGELIMHFIKMFVGRDKETKIYYVKLIYDEVLKQYNENLKNNNDIPNDYNIVSGFIIVVESINISEPSFFRESSVYLALLNNLFKCTDSNNINIKKEFIKFMPELYYINKNEFKSKYEKQFIEYINSLLNTKTNSELRNQLLLTLGKFSYIIKDDGYKIFINQFFKLLINLISEQSILDDELLKCLSDLFNNKINIFTNKIKSIDILAILPRIFKTPLSTYKIDYLISIMKFYSYDSMENIITAITSLNAISYILFEDFFVLYHFNKNIGNKKKYINQKLHNILINMRSDISASNLEQNNNDILNIRNKPIENLNIFNNNSNTVQLISNALTLFSLIPNNLFYKDMLIFFNDKLLPLLIYVPNKIYKKIMDLILCDFVKIYHDDVNLSEYIFFNIAEALYSSGLEDRNLKTQLYCYKIFMKKEKFTEILTKNKNSPIMKLADLTSIRENSIKENIIKEISKFALKDPDKNYYFIYLKKFIYGIAFKFYYLDDIIEKDNLSYDLYYFTSNLINFIYPSLVVIILDVANYLILIDDLKSIMIINIFKTVIELFKSDLIKEIKDDIFFKESCYLLLILCFDIMRMESIYESKYDIILELIYCIIKQENIDIFNLEEIINKIKTSSYFMGINKKREKTTKLRELMTNTNLLSKLKTILEKQNNKNILEILYRNILNVDNENCVLNTLKIFGLCGAIDPNKMQNIFRETNNIKYLFEIDNNYKLIEERGIQIITFNNKLKQYEELDTSFTDFFNIKAVLYCMELLKMNKQQELSKKIIDSLSTLIKSIKKKESNLIDIILPTLIQIIPKFQIKQQKLLFECIRIILNNFENKSRKYMDDLIPFVINYLETNYLDIISKIISILFEKYKKEFENYYSIIIPKYISIIKSADNDYFTYDKLFILFIRNNEISSYLKILGEELKIKFYEETSPKYIFGLLCLVEQICHNKNCKVLYSSFISLILRKIQFMLDLCRSNVDFKNDQNKLIEYFLKTGENSEIHLSILNKIIDIFNKINENAREELVSYLPLILSNFIQNGLINYSTIKQKLKSLIKNDRDYTFMTCEEYKKKIFSESWKINCIYGFSSLNEQKIGKKEKARTFIENDNMIKYKSIDNNLVLSVFDNNHCNLEKDWDEWHKSSIKLLLQHSPSIYIYNCNVITDYYLSIATELSNYGFYTLYMNSNDKVKNKLIKYINRALKGKKANDDIFLSLLDLLETMERRKANMFMLDYRLFGEISYNLKAYAKSLFYFEKDFLLNNDSSIFEKLIKLYYQLGIPESAMGLIKLAERHEYEDVDKFNKKYVWYINLNDYKKALEMIKEKLKVETDINEINELKKNRNICLNGLLNWEEILLEEEGNNYINNDFNEIREDEINSEEKPKDKYKEIKEVIEKEIFLSEVNIYLDRWDNLKTYISKINEKIKENFEIDDMIIENKEDFNNSDIILIKNNETKNASFIQSNEKILSDGYISYNDLILKDIYLFDKMDEMIIFNLNIISSIVNIMEGKYELAIRYKNDAKEVILNKIKSLLKESHTRGYSLLINNQELSYLEDIIEFKQNHEGDINYLKEMKKQWDKSFSKISFEPMYCERLLYLYSFIFPEKEIFDTKIKIANNYRKFGFYEQSKVLFQTLKTKIENITKNEKDILSLKELNEKKIKIDINYNRCLFEIGEIDKAIKNSKILVDLLKSENPNNNEYQKLNNQLKGKIYGDYALYLKKDLINKIMKQSLHLKQEKKFFIVKKNDSHSPQLIHKNNLLYSLSNKILPLKSKIIPKIGKSRELLLSYSKNKPLESSFIDYFKSKTFKNNYKTIDNINHYLILSTKYYDKNYKYWYHFSSFNYGCYKRFHNRRIKANESTFENHEKTFKQCLSMEIAYATNAIYGIRHCFILAGNNLDKNFQNCIRIIDIFFNLGGESEELLTLITSVFLENNYKKIFVQALPLLISRLGNKNIKILEKLILSLVEICKNFPSESLIPLIINKYSSSIKRKSIANQVLHLIEKKNPELKNVIEDYKTFINELNKCSLLLHEKWKEAIEEAAKMLVSRNYNSLIEILNKVHKQMNEFPDNLYEINFNQTFYNELKEAEYYLKQYIIKPNDRYIKEAWVIYQNVYNNIKSKYKNMFTISLEYISPLLSNIKENQVGLPGYFFLKKLNMERKQLIIGKAKYNNSIDDNNSVFLKKMDKYLYVLNTKQRPRKISFIGTDNKEYKYLLKSHEDLRQDERIIQVFNFVNSILSHKKEISNKNLYITIYPVIPLSHMTGLIGFLPNCDTISHLITEERKNNGYITNIEIISLYQIYPKYDSASLLSKVEVFKDINHITNGNELSDILWTKSVNCESWLIRRTNYSRSLSVMSVVGYILGLGDRHPNNLMMDRQSGKIIHIDYGDCFEIAMKRNKFPEKVPFRLTRMLVKALGISRVEGTFRIISEKVMKLLRENKDSLLAILNTLVYDPLVSFRFMIPILMKIKEQENNTPHKNINMFNSPINEDNNFENIPNISSSVINTSFEKFSKVLTFNLNNKKNLNPEISLIKEEEEKAENLEENKVEKEKEEKKRIENEERQLLNYYEENDEIEFEELNKIAQYVLNRINEKLTGTDFSNAIPLDVEEQIDRLINQATSNENLSQSYLGWCPFW